MWVDHLAFPAMMLNLYPPGSRCVSVPRDVLTSDLTVGLQATARGCAVS